MKGPSEKASVPTTRRAGLFAVLVFGIVGLTVILLIRVGHLAEAPPEKAGVLDEVGLPGAPRDAAKEVRPGWVRRLSEGGQVSVKSASDLEVSLGTIKGLGKLREEELVRVRKVVRSLRGSRARRLAQVEERLRGAQEDAEAMAELGECVFAMEEIEAAEGALENGSYYLTETETIPMISGYDFLTLPVARDGRELSLTIVMSLEDFTRLANAKEYRDQMRRLLLQTICDEFNSRDYTWRKAVIDAYRGDAAGEWIPKAIVEQYFRPGIAYVLDNCTLVVSEQ